MVQQGGKVGAQTTRKQKSNISIDIFIKAKQKLRVQEDSDKYPNSTTAILKFGPIISDFSVCTAEQATALLYKVTSLNTMKLSTPKLAFTLRPRY